MRRVVFGALALAAITAAPALGQASPTKFGYINSQLLLEQAPGAQAAAQQFERELGAMRSQLEPLAQELDSLMSQFEAQAVTLSDQARATRQQTILQKQQVLADSAGGMEAQAEQRRAQLVQPIMDRISRTIEAIRIEGGYALIFDVTAGSIIAADPSLDLTQEVLRRLQNSAGGAPGAGN